MAYYHSNVEFWRWYWYCTRGPTMAYRQSCWNSYWCTGAMMTPTRKLKKCCCLWWSTSSRAYYDELGPMYLQATWFLVQEKSHVDQYHVLKGLQHHGYAANDVWSKDCYWWDHGMLNHGNSNLIEWDYPFASWSEKSIMITWNQIEYLMTGKKPFPTFLKQCSLEKRLPMISPW